MGSSAESVVCMQRESHTRGIEVYTDESEMARSLVYFFFAPCTRLDTLLQQNQKLSSLNLALGKKHEELAQRATEYLRDHHRPPVDET